jgi:hypothetical protein
MSDYIQNAHIAIIEINPSAEFRIVENDVDNIEWLNGTTPISPEDIKAKASEINTRDAHIEPRHKSYPSVKDQLDMMYHNFDNWKATIKAIKDKYPKED